LLFHEYRCRLRAVRWVWRLGDGDGLAVVDRATDHGVKTAILTGYAFAMPRDHGDPARSLAQANAPTELITAIERCAEKYGA